MARLQEVAIVLKYLSAAYGQTVTADQAKAYHIVLKQLPRLQLVDASTAWLANEKWFPKAAELLDMALRYVKPQGDPTTEAAWWFAFAHGYESTDDFTEADVKAIYAEAGVPMYQELTTGE